MLILVPNSPVAAFIGTLAAVIVQAAEKSKISLDYAAGVAAFAARRRSRYRRTALIRNHNPGMITVNQGMMAAMAVMSAARLSPRTEPESRSASPTDAKA